MEWEGWPHAHLSRFIDCRPHRWHLQEAGEGPTILLIHGAGAGLMSYRHLLPLLATDFRVVAIDLPGHAFTRMGTRQRQGLEPMANDLAMMLGQESIRPDIIVGHSAGAALAIELARRLDQPPRGIVGINAALDNFKGVAGWLFPAMAKLLALNPFTAHTFARLSSSGGSVRALLRSTGSRTDDEGVALYRRLIANPEHVDGALAMMSQWNLAPLRASLPQMTVPTTLLAAERDRAVPPETSDEAAMLLPDARVIRFAGLGHLMHEEDPKAVNREIRRFWDQLRGTQTEKKKAAG